MRSCPRSVWRLIANHLLTFINYYVNYSCYFSAPNLPDRNNYSIGILIKIFAGLVLSWVRVNFRSSELRSQFPIKGGMASNWIAMQTFQEGSTQHTFYNLNNAIFQGIMIQKFHVVSTLPCYCRSEPHKRIKSSIELQRLWVALQCAI